MCGREGGDRGREREKGGGREGGKEGRIMEEEGREEEGREGGIVMREHKMCDTKCQPLGTHHTNEFKAF